MFGFPRPSFKKSSRRGVSSGTRLVSVLFRCCSPSTITWPIAAIIIDAFKGHAFRLESHISKEVLEASSFAGIPAVTDCNASTAVVNPRGARRNETAISHTFPSAPSGSPRHTVFATVSLHLSKSFRRMFPTQVNQSELSFSGFSLGESWRPTHDWQYTPGRGG